MNKDEINWNVTPKDAIAQQKLLRDRIILTPLTSEPKLIGGCDVSMNRFAKEGYAGFVVLSYPELELVAHSVVKSEIPFPYIPGLLSYREIPMLMQAWEKLEKKPDVLMVDGIGIAHPRRLGIATHLGLILEIPTIGCAKSVLTGTYNEPASEAGSVSYLYDRYNKSEIIGAAVRTKKNVKPMFISPGNRITLEDSIDLVLKCIRKHRLPEPTRFAHNTVNEYRVADMSEQSTLA